MSDSSVDGDVLTSRESRSLSHWTFLTYLTTFYNNRSKAIVTDTILYSPSVWFLRFYCHLSTLIVYHIFLYAKHRRQNLRS